MKENKFQNGIDGMKEVKLAAHEKQAMLARLLNHIDQNPATQKTQKWPPIVFISSTWHHRFVPAIAITLIILLASGGTIFASSAALPGDLLYPVKINVAEPVRSAVTVGVPAKAKWEGEKAARRLDEATKVAAEGRLTESMAEELQKQFNFHAKKFNDLEQELEKNRDTDEAVTIHNEFEAKVNARARILKEVSDHAPTIQKQAVKNFEDSVKERTDEVAKVRTRIEKKFIEQQEKNLEQTEKFKIKQKEIQDSIKKGREQLNTNYDISQGLRKEILDNASATLYDAQNNLDRANEKNRSGNDDDAYTSLFSAERHADEANISIGDSLKFKQKEDRKQDRENSGKDNQQKQQVF